MTTKEIIDATSEYPCFGENYGDLMMRIDAARTLSPGSVVVDFGTGQGRYAISMALANPAIKIYTFDQGRQHRRILDVDYVPLIKKRISKLEIENIEFKLGNAVDIYPEWEKPIGLLNVDVESGYDEADVFIKKWFPFVKRNSLILIQSFQYPLGKGEVKYPGLRKAVIDYVGENMNYEFGDQISNTRIIIKNEI